MRIPGCLFATLTGIASNGDRELLSLLRNTLLRHVFGPKVQEVNSVYNSVDNRSNNFEILELSKIA